MVRADFSRFEDEPEMKRLKKLLEESKRSE